MVGHEDAERLKWLTAKLSRLAPKAVKEIFRKTQKLPITLAWLAIPWREGPCLRFSKGICSLRELRLL